MKGATGPFGGYISMGGLFTIVKVRDRLKSYDEDPGWYQHAPGTVRSRRPMRILRETVLGQANTAGG